MAETTQCPGAISPCRRPRLPALGSGLTLALGLALPLLGVSAVVWPARAEPMPRYDTERYCRKMSGLSGGANGQLFNNCLRSERRTRDRVASRWPGVPARVQVHCDRLARSVGFGRYERLRSCVDQQIATQEHRRRLRTTSQGRHAPNRTARAETPGRAPVPVPAQP